MNTPTTLLPACRPSKLIPLVVLVLATLWAAAPADEGEEGTPIAFGMPNPAAFYCSELGYRYEIERTPEGERGVCVLPDGRRVDAWDFMRGKCGDGYGYCERLGHHTVPRTTSDGWSSGECAVCVSDEGEEIGTVWELMDLANALTPLISPRPMDEPPPKTRRSAARVGPHWGPEVHGRFRVLPTYWNWFEAGGCTPIKDQGNCGSCWAFSAVGSFESDIKIKDGIAVDLSEQWLVSCNSDDWSCGGGYFAHRYHQWKTDPCDETGAVMESDFPYAADDLPCECPYPHEYFLDGWGHIAGEDGLPTTEEIKASILDHGPIEVAVFVDDVFIAYTQGVFRACDNYWYPNHTVVLVGWDDSLGTDGAWLLRNSWGSYWGQDGYMWIEYGCNFVGLGACWNSYRDPIRIDFPDGLPQALYPGRETSISIRISEITDTYVPGSGSLRYRYGAGSFSSAPLVHQEGDLYKAILPPADCLQHPEFYVSVEGARYGTLTSPQRAPDDLHRCPVGLLSVVFSDDFETDKGWAVYDEDELIDGSWERGVPVGGGARGDPPTDYDGSGSCYVTGNEAGNSDVDGGATRLMSPRIDISDADDIVVRYALWYTNSFGNNPNQDVLRMHVYGIPSGWYTAETIGPMTPVPVDWHVRSLAVGDYVDWSSGFWIRFGASDREPWSVVEAGIDAVEVSILKCDPTGAPDSIEPSGYALKPATPNPFSASTQMVFHVPSAGPVELSIYDASGRVVRELLSSESWPAGEHVAVWDGRGPGGERVASGTYFCRLQADGKTLGRKVILLR